MNEHDPLSSALSEWQAPEPSPALDARVLAAYRGLVRPPWWLSLWSFRVSIPVPVLAAVLVVLSAALWLQFRSGPPAAQPAPGAPSNAGYMTRLETAGFQPLPEGAVRVVRAAERKPGERKQ